MRAGLSIFALALACLGLWLIAADSLETGAPDSSVAQIRGRSQPAASPVMLGVALLAGGVVCFILILKRR